MQVDRRVETLRLTLWVTGVDLVTLVYVHFLQDYRAYNFLCHTETSLDEVGHVLEGSKDALEDSRVEIKAKCAECNDGMDYAVIISFGANEGDSCG